METTVGEQNDYISDRVEVSANITDVLETVNDCSVRSGLDNGLVKLLAVLTMNYEACEKAV